MEAACDALVKKLFYEKDEDRFCEIIEKLIDKFEQSSNVDSLKDHLAQ
jgi:hypothetical protein